MATFTQNLGKNAKIEVQRTDLTGSPWRRVGGVSQVDFAPGEADTTTDSLFDGTVQTVGAPSPGTVTFTIGSFIPQQPSWGFILDKQAANENINIRWTTKGQRIHTPDPAGTFAIATDGEITFAAGSEPDLKIASTSLAAGMMIYKTGQTALYYVIDQMTEQADGVTFKAYTDPLASAVAAQKPYVIDVPNMRYEVTQAGITSAGSIGLESEGRATSSLVVAPTAVLGQPAIVFDF